MRLTPTLIALLFAGSLPLHSLADDHEPARSAFHDYRVTTVTEGLERPWSLAFLPDGTLLITEKAGRLRVFRDGVLEDAAIDGIPAVHTVGQGGLLDVVPHPAYADNGWLYLSYAKPLGEGSSTTAVLRGKLRDGALVDQEPIFQAVSSGRGHFGSRLVFDTEGYLFITIGDRQVPPEGDLEAHPAQDLSNHHGTVVRLHDDGRIPADNPFQGQDGALPDIWSYGHRNAQGMMRDPDSGDLWITEHGPRGGDELNLIVGGENYGWPVVGYGVNYRGGTAIHGATVLEGWADPTHIWVPSTGVSGLARYEGEAFPHWTGFLLAGGLSGQRISLLHMDGQEVTREETLFQGHGRVRDVRVGPDGLIYVAIDARDGTSPILRMEPVPRGPIE